MNNRDSTDSYFRVAASFAICSMIVLLLIYLPEYMRGGSYITLLIPIAFCTGLILLSIPIMNYIRKVWAADNSDAGYFQAANLLAIFSMVSFILIRLPEYVSHKLYLKAAVLLIAVLGAIAVMIVLMIKVKKITTLAFWIPLVIFISYTTGTIYLRGASYYFLVYLVICGIGASYYDYKKMFRFMFLSNCVLLVLIFLRMPLLGEAASFNDTLVAWIITVYISIFLLMLSRFSTDKSSRSARALDSFSTMMAATPNLVALVDEMNRVTYISKPLAVWAHIEDYEMAVGRPLIDLFHEMEMKIIISEILLSEGAYEGTKDLTRNGKTFYFKIIANDLQGSTGGKFIDIGDITPIVEARLEAERAAAAKTNFLANTSHEIRTPMNAILGMAELLLRKDIAPDVYEDAMGIKQAGSNLMAIINEILDFSKIESGKMEILPAEYHFASLINDVISIIRMRLAEKPVLFIVDIDPMLPAQLKGDEVRIRQVLLNLLSNAVKYTRKGYITLTITGKTKGDQILLTIGVADTGIGIREENMDKLFGEFVQFDSHKNRGIEGTGLGLAISLNLCHLMGGDITVESKYGEGSVFTATLPQTVMDDALVASVNAPETKPVLLYETREPYAASIIRSLEKLGVPVRAVHDPEDLYRELEQSKNTGAYSFVFVSADMAEKTLALLKTLELQTVPAVLSDMGEISSFQNVVSISMPAYVLSIANALNGKQTVSYQKKANTAFIAPDAKILIVDDSVTNLTVARGLLALYQMDIHVSTSGMEAIDLVRKNTYDIVFMDHMMPEMDGIETTEAIRALGGDFRNLPVIALTANAVSGMREMFLEKGFNDYLAKPIEIAKLNEIIRRWIPRDKQQKSAAPEQKPAETGGRADRSSAIQIPGLDTERGIAMTGGVEAGYRKVLVSFYRDACERLPSLKETPAENDLLAFATQVHALKSAAATVGAAELSRRAANLEAAGKAGNLAAIREGLPSFYGQLSEMIERLGRALDLSRDEAPVSAAAVSPPQEFQPLFKALRRALETMDIENVDRLLADIETKDLDAKTKETITVISDLVLITEFESAIAKLNPLIG